MPDEKPSLVFRKMETNYGRAKAKSKKHLSKYVRNASSNFVKRKDVKEYVLKKSGYECLNCGSKNKLQVDHIISVYRILKDSIPIEKINHVDNLQALCVSCNASKAP